MEMQLTTHNGPNETEPDINQQIEYVNHIRNHVVKHIKPLQSEMRMIRAIEQTLIATKWLAWSEEAEKNKARHQASGRNDRVSVLNKLSRAELSILYHVAQGHSLKAIAEKLCLSVNTVNNHQYNIRKKINLKGRKSLQAYAVAAIVTLNKLVGEYRLLKLNRER